MVLHNQDDDIYKSVDNLNYQLSSITDRLLVHCGPLIRKEEIYEHIELKEHIKVFNSLYFFSLKVPVQVKSIVVDKKECDPNDDLALSTRLVHRIEEINKRIQRKYKTIDDYNALQKSTIIIMRLYNPAFTQ